MILGVSMSSKLSTHRASSKPISARGKLTADFAYAKATDVTGDADNADGRESVWQEAHEGLFWLAGTRNRVSKTTSFPNRYVFSAKGAFSMPAWGIAPGF